MAGLEFCRFKRNRMVKEGLEEKVRVRRFVGVVRDLFSGSHGARERERGGAKPEQRWGGLFALTSLAVSFRRCEGTSCGE